MNIIKKLFLFFIVSILFILINSCSQFGRKPDDSLIKSFEKSENFNKNDEIFENQEKEIYKVHEESFSLLKVFWRGLWNKNKTSPNKKLPAMKVRREQLINKGIQFSWLGHSSVLLNINDKNILFDPVLSMHASPVSFAVRRFQKLPFDDVKDLPVIDYIIISHDHYDHLDKKTVEKFKNTNAMFLVPLGVSSHLIYWGGKESNIFVFDWWDDLEINGLKFHCTPSQHFSGRSFISMNTTLWSSWVVESEKFKIYFSGDSGYNKHFKEIAEKFGDFDLAFLENGQYDKSWPLMHMHPDETVKAATDLRAKYIVPIHWGAFTLSLHNWYDPPESLMQHASKQAFEISFPIIGDLVNINESKEITKTFQWWKDSK